MYRLMLGFLLTAYTAGVLAFQPDEGWWFNNTEPGRGWNLEYQNGTMFVSTFVYRPDGQQLWYTSSGTYNPATGVFNGTFDLSVAGQCLGCPYRPPQTQSAAGGPISIVFDSAISARLTYSGGTININRFNFGFPTVNSLLYGSWTITRQSVITDGELIVMDGTTTSSGTEFITGRRFGTNNLIVGNYSNSLQRMALLLDSSTSFYEFWVVDMTFDKMEGRGWLYQKTSSPTGSGDPTFGFRIGYRNDPINPVSGAAKRAGDFETFNQAALPLIEQSGSMPAELQALELQLRSVLLEQQAQR